MDIATHIQTATIPMLKHICDEKGITHSGSAKPQVTHTILTYIGDDKAKEADIRLLVDHLVRDRSKQNKENKKKKKEIVVQADVHENSGVNKRTVVNDSHSRVTIDNCMTNQESENIGITDCGGKGNSEVENGDNDQSEVTQPLFSQEYGRPSETFSIDNLEDLEDQRPKSTSTEITDTSIGDGEDEEIDDDVINEALTGGHGLNSSVFHESFIDDSQYGNSPKAGKQKRVRFSEQGNSEDKLELIVSILVEMRGAFVERMDQMQGQVQKMEDDNAKDKDQAAKKIQALETNMVRRMDQMQEQLQKMEDDKAKDKEQAAKKIQALETNIVKLSQISGEAMEQVKSLIKEKSDASELANQMAKKTLEMAEELKKERTQRLSQQEAYTKELREIRQGLTGINPGQTPGGQVQQDNRTNQMDVNVASRGITDKTKTSTSQVPKENNKKKQSRDKNKRTDISASSDEGVALVVGDSNLDLIVPGRLHETKQVRKLKRATIKEAEENIAWGPHDKVTDIVLHIGGNDMRKGMTATEVKDGIKRVQGKYKEHFKKARFHLSALPPSESKQEVNWHLRELAQETKSNFISLKEMKDHRTKGLVAGMTERGDEHLTVKGTKILAAGLKRSLYSKANMENTPNAGRATSMLTEGLDRLTKTVAEILSQEA